MDGDRPRLPSNRMGSLWALARLISISSDFLLLVVERAR